MRAVIYALCLLPAAADASATSPHPVPVVLVTAHGRRTAELDVTASRGGSALTKTEERRQGAAAGVSYLSIGCAVGKRTSVLLGKGRPIPVVPMHLYRISARLRRVARTDLWLEAIQPGADPPQVRVLPGWSYLAPPVWETVPAFYIAPDKTRAIHFRLNVRNLPTGLPTATVDLASIEIADAGALVALDPPRRVLRWDRMEIGPKLKRLPHVPSSGAGVYRIRARAQTETKATFRLLLAQGDDRRLHWHRTSEIGITRTIPPGSHPLEWVYLIPDRRFIHQWIRGLTHHPDHKVVLTDLVLEQTMVEPPGADKLGLQAPKQR